MTGTVALLFAYGFVVMVLLGYFIVTVVCAGRISSSLSWALSPVVGMGASFIIQYIFRRPMATVEMSLLVLLFVVRLLQKRSSSAQEDVRARAPLSALWLAGMLPWMTLASFVWVAAGPHGEWDGWAIWNAHSRYIYRAGPTWQQHIVDTAHPDYPLLIPLTTARSWRYVGKDVPHLSGIQLVLIGVSGVLILAASLWELRANSLSLLIPLLLVGTPFYLMLGVWQYADMPLSIYILSTLALLCIQRSRDPDGVRLLILAGFAAGCAASTKNEGWLFVAAVLLAQLLAGFRQLAITIKRVAMFTAGLVLPLVMTLHFKFTVPPPNDLLKDRAFHEVLAKILDPERYLTIADAFLKYAGSFGHWPIHSGIPLLAVLIVWGIDRAAIRSEAWRIGALSVAIVLAGYFAVYVMTHLPLDYHLPTSLDRLLLHLWPSVLFLAGLAVRTPLKRTPE